MNPRQKFGVVLVVVLCVHAALLTSWNRAQSAHFSDSPLRAQTLTLELRKPAPDKALPIAGKAPKLQALQPTPPQPQLLQPPTTTPADAMDTAAQAQPAPDAGKQAEGSEPSPLPAPRYFMPQELTVRPTVRADSPAPAAYALPDVRPIPVVVHVYIGEQGNVDDVVLEDSFLSDPAKQYIHDAFIAMRFHPGTMGTLAVRSQITVEVRLDTVQ
jgi:hypothetical protein